MIKGMINCAFDGEKSDIEVPECDMLFAAGIKKVEETEDGCGYVAMNLALGGVKSSHAIECLATSVISQIGKIHEDDPIRAYAAMQQFKSIANKQIDKFMLDNLTRILEMKREGEPCQ